MKLFSFLRQFINTAIYFITYDPVNAVLVAALIIICIMAILTLVIPN